MDPRQLKDPAAGVPMQLLPHFHLVSKHKYPMLTNPSPDTLVTYLLEAPKIMREMSPVQWQFLDAPPDGSIFLAWQPTEYLQMNFASDGYVWSDAEQPFNSDVRGYTLQMLWLRAGYRPGTEAMTIHSRRRYRLLPNASNQQQQIGMPSPDPSLWLVHYSKASARDQHPAASLQMLLHVTQQFQQRQMIQRSGQLPRKEFMFADRSSWPIIQLPAGLGRSASSGQLAGGQGHRRGQSLAHEATVEEEEDVSRGDVLDFMTPREISRMRYEQHHEWMEEVLESPYATKQIIPSELGLGRKGVLESFTNGFFTAPISTTHDPVNGKVGKLDPAKAEEFTKHANAKLEEMQADLEKMKQHHIRRMEKLRRTTDLGAAERKLRNMNVADDSYKDIAAQVQNLVGRKIEPVSKVACVSRGGLQDIKPVVPEPRQQHYEQNINPQAQHQAQTQTQNNQQQQQQQQYQQRQAQPQPQQYPQQQQQQAQVQSAQPQQQPQSTQQAQSQAPNNTEVTRQDSTPAPTDLAPVVPKPPEIPDQQDSNIENNDALDNNDDIDMGDLGVQDLPTGDGSGDNGDWDMVNDQETGQDNQEQADNQLGSDELGDGQPQSSDQGRMQQSNQSGNDTPGNDFDMVNDFDTNMDTAGDALADYNPDDDLNLDDSAFGDAFHHTEQEMS